MVKVDHEPATDPREEVSQKMGAEILAVLSKYTVNDLDVFTGIAHRIRRKNGNRDRRESIE